MTTHDAGERDQDAFDPVHEHQAPGPASQRYRDDSEQARSETGGGQVSEAGGASLNQETSQGGADAVPDTHG